MLVLPQKKKGIRLALERLAAAATVGATGLVFGAPELVPVLLGAAGAVEILCRVKEKRHDAKVRRLILQEEPASREKLFKQMRRDGDRIFAIFYENGVFKCAAVAHRDPKEEARLMEMGAMIPPKEIYQRADGGQVEYLGL